KAKHAVQDEALLMKLCKTLIDIFGDKPFPYEYQDLLLAMLRCRLQFPSNQEGLWLTLGQTWTWVLLDKGFLQAASYCLNLYNGHKFVLRREDPVGQDRVDFTGLVGNTPVVLVEAKSLSVMVMVCNLLLSCGIKLKWAPKRPLAENILQKAALYLGMKNVEWLFLTCHNHWIVCHLVKGIKKKEPFLAYSLSCSIKNNSEPFQAFLGAILSTLNGVPVQPSIHNTQTRLVQIPEDREGGPLPEDGVGDSSGAYQGSSRTEGQLFHQGGQLPIPMQVLITLSSSQFPESFQLWIHLHPLPANTFALLKCAKSGNGKQHIWLTHFIGYRSTGSV
ncbi:hypothetical protein EDB84DRAFT_1277475, partial [Lactarius hengduanensis]